MQNKEIDELLERIFSNVNLWLNFAEAKNAANIALVIACLTGIFKLENMKVLLGFISVFLIVSGVSSLISFFPRLGNKISKRILFCFDDKERCTNHDNLLFFEHIKKYSNDAYIDQLLKKYFDKDKYDPTPYQLDLSDEIVYNSIIASYKYRFFRIAVCLDIAAFSTLILFVILA